MLLRTKTNEDVFRKEFWKILMITQKEIDEELI
jgi:hypothetical protein